MVNIDRVLKIMSGHIIAIDNIEKKLNRLTNSNVEKRLKSRE